jgi:transcriptional regulator with GAF, ATPase, and Fis domain
MALTPRAGGAHSRRVSPPERTSERTRTEATLDPARPLGSVSPALPPGRLLAVYEVGRQLLEQRRPDEVLEAMRQAIVQHLQPDRACALARAGDAWRPLFAYEFDGARPLDEWPLSWTVVRQAFDGDRAVLASDVSQDPQLADAGSIQRFRIRSVLCVPLGRPPRGVVYLDNRSERPFSAADLEFVTAMALYASLVLQRTEEHARDAEALRRSADRVDALQAELLAHHIVGAAPALLAAYDALRRFARSGARVLLQGETGTGKELFARAYAAHSPRTSGPYVPVTIPALAAGVVESELFGHVRGAFTEASRDKKGRLEIADGGVLFLDEVGDIDPPVQTKLLRFLDSGELYRVGDTAARRVDALVVSATNRDLEKEVAAGRFRADLLARLGHVVRLPPLRARLTDVPLLVDHFLRRHEPRGSRRFSPEAMGLLQRHTWPFNVRELQQVVERTACLVDDALFLPAHLPEYLAHAASRPASDAQGPPAPLREVVEEAERRAILGALEFTGGNRRRAIELLKVSPETFYRRLEEFGLHKKGAIE